MIIVIAGPTAVGKSRLALRLAEYFDGEIISADSVQIYKRLDIGSDKPSEESRRRVSHHLVDCLDIDEAYSSARFQRDAREAIEHVEKNGRVPFLVGGTGYYIKSALHDFSFEDSSRDEDRERELKTWNLEKLHDYLERLDPVAAEKIHPNNKKRLLHAITRAERNRPIGEDRSGETPVYDYHMLVLYMERERLYKRIETRVDEMFENGLLEEARRLFEEAPECEASKAIGYKELFAHFRGECTLEEAKGLIKQKSRRYAKRQLTYFRNQFDAHWIHVDVERFEQTVEASVESIRDHLR